MVQIDKLPAATQQSARQQFDESQAQFSHRIARAFSSSLGRIFVTATALLLVAGVLVFMIHERVLARASAMTTPGAE